MIDCPEAVRRMWAYLDRSLDPVPVREFEAHLDTCLRCCGELEFSRHLRELVATRSQEPVIPADVRGRLERLLAAESDDRRGPAA